MTVTSHLTRNVFGLPSVGSPISCPNIGRRYLSTLTRTLGFTRGAEVGVWKGEFSAHLCEGNPSLHMLCVDPWVSYPAWRDTKNSLTGSEAEAFMAAAHHAAVQRLSGLNCTVLREFSADAARKVPDASLDFVYIDGNHTFQAVLDDLAAWTPKVKLGGFVSGHDYKVTDRKPFIQVVAAVQQWTKDKHIEPWFVLGADKSPSFLWEVR